MGALSHEEEWTGDELAGRRQGEMGKGEGVCEEVWEKELYLEYKMKLKIKKWQNKVRCL